MASPSFHAFVFDKRILCGLVTNPTLGGGKVDFEYEYMWDSVHVKGKFVGKVEGDGTVVKGDWNEASNKPVEDKSHWSGSATLYARDVDGNRSVLSGLWEGDGFRERWTIDIQK